MTVDAASYICDRLNPDNTKSIASPVICFDVDDAPGVPAFFSGDLYDDVIVIFGNRFLTGSNTFTAIAFIFNTTARALLPVGTGLAPNTDPKVKLVDSLYAFVNSCSGTSESEILVSCPGVFLASVDPNDSLVSTSSGSTVPLSILDWLNASDGLPSSSVS